jgi:hypothetical protein
MGSLKFNKHIYIITTIAVYTLIGFMPTFRIKLTPPVEMSPSAGRLYYFFHNFTSNWGFKIILALIIAAIISVLICKSKNTES